MIGQKTEITSRVRYDAYGMMGTTTPIALIALMVLAGCDSNPTDSSPVITSISITAPLANSIVNSADVVFRGNASDNNTITRVTYALNGAEPQEVAVMAGKIVDFEFTVPALETGLNTIVVSAHNKGGSQIEADRQITYAAVRYKVIAISNDHLSARGLNETGVVAGYSVSGSDEGDLAFRWSDSGLIQLPPPAGHNASRAYDLNASLLVVGVSDLLVEPGSREYPDRRRVHQPVAWTENVPEILPLIEPYVEGVAVVINDDGIIAGSVMDITLENWAAALWRDGELHLIKEDATVSDINADGVITGDSFTGGVTRAFRWANGEITILEPLPGYPHSSGMAINDAGDVVGISFDLQSTAYQATLWRGTTPTSLGQIPNGIYYRTWGVNNNDQAVGRVDAEGFGHFGRFAFISHDGRMTLLNHLVTGEWNIIDAFAINDAGQIAAIATHKASSDPPGGYQYLAVLLNPVEPKAAGAITADVIRQPTGPELDRATLDRIRPHSNTEKWRDGMAPGH